MILASRRYPTRLPSGVGHRFGPWVGWLWCAVIVVCVAGPARAEILPDQLIRDTSERLFSEFGANRQALEQDRHKLYGLVTDVVVPHFDVVRMSRLVLGNHWRGATPEQQARFVDEFRTLLVRTYATALFEYTGRETISIKPVKIKDGDRQALVRTALDLGTGPPVAINYVFLDIKGQWKVVDVTIEGVSLVTTYRSTYREMIQTSGMDALIDSLTDKNRNLES